MRRITKGLLAVLVLSMLAITGCSGEVETSAVKDLGSETAPLYSGDLFASQRTVSFSSGEEMKCYDLVERDYSRSGDTTNSLSCDWSQAPLYNINISKESRKDGWRLIFLEVSRGTTVCIAKDWQKHSELISCKINGVQR